MFGLLKAFCRNVYCLFVGHSEPSEVAYSASDSCIQKCPCIRCGKILWQRIKHTDQLGDWQYLEPDSCKEGRVCSRCGAVAESRTNHPWSEWTTSLHDKCTLKKQCPRCGMEKATTNHIYPKTTSPYGTCQHCHEENPAPEQPDVYKAYNEVDYGDRGAGSSVH